jgi:ubiquinone/menaquinone biosynthesis C-methylase UbiE
MKDMQPSDETINNIVNYYDTLYSEQTRLSDTLGRIEFVRTQGILRRYLKQPPTRVLDVGGGAGRYACWLAQAGYEIHLIDPVPLHIQQARSASAEQAHAPIASCTLGDARQLKFDSGTADAVLLMGPLYHLVEAQDRHQALTEAYRVLKTGGCLFAAGISRFASCMDGLVSGFMRDPAFQQIMLRDLQDGQHRNPAQNPAYFTTAFFHHPDELAEEVRRAGFHLVALLAVEGLSGLVKDLDQLWDNESRREFLLGLMGKIEQEPSLLGASPHLLCVAEKQ